MQLWERYTCYKWAKYFLTSSCHLASNFQWFGTTVLHLARPILAISIKICSSIKSSKFFTVKGIRYTTDSDYKKYTGQLSHRAVFSISSALALCFLNNHKIYYVGLLYCSWNETDPSNTNLQTSLRFHTCITLQHPVFQTKFCKQFSWAAQWSSQATSVSKINKNHHERQGRIIQLHKFHFNDFQR